MQSHLVEKKSLEKEEDLDGVPRSNPLQSSHFSSFPPFLSPPNMQRRIFSRFKKNGREGGEIRVLLGAQRLIFSDLNRQTDRTGKVKSPSQLRFDLVSPRIFVSFFLAFVFVRRPCLFLGVTMLFGVVLFSAASVVSPGKKMKQKS